MPELPEVECARKLVETNCKGSTIIEVITLEQGGGPRTNLFDEKVYECSSYSDVTAAERSFVDILKGAELVSVERKGKQLWFDLKDRDSVLFHFGMTGAFVVKDVAAHLYKSFKIDADIWPPKFTKIELEFSNGTKLAFTDPRRFGRIRLRKTPLLEPPISTLAVDPVLGPLPSADELCAQLGRHKAPIKAVLLDQEKVFCGLGNWLVDEILYQSAIHPATPSDAIDASDAASMLTVMTYILHTSIASNIDYSSFPEHWLFHSRWDKGKTLADATPMFNGQKVVFETHGGRTTAIVPSVQLRRSKSQAVAVKSVGVVSAVGKISKVARAVLPKLKR